MLPVQHIYKQVGTAGILYAWFVCMHTRIDVVLSNTKEEEGKQITEAIYKRLFDLEKTGNCYDSLSELSTLNNSKCGMPTIVGNDLYSMIEMCVWYNQKTKGYFDISIDSDDYSVDTIKSVHLSEKDSTVTLHREGVKLNLSGFIKGYGLDEVKKILQEKGIDNALINIGNSSVLAMGDHPFGEGWKVGIDFPATSGEKKEIILKNKCLTTSGNHTLQRKHIRSPYTGEFIEGVKGVSVITDSAAEGEVLSTALFAAQTEERGEILRHFEAIIYNL
ncbi:FAD:protein FMN transferase [Dysgonomonas sp.]|nr:FAD:protein FMN transferase [Prevotella sp.]